MELNKDTYTKEEVQEFVNQFQTTITDLTGKVEEGNKAIEKIAELEKTNVANAIKLEMTKLGLDESYFDLVDSADVAQAQAKINKLVELNKTKATNNTYVPENHKSTNEYHTAEQAGNIEGMIGAKINKLFE